MYLLRVFVRPLYMVWLLKITSSIYQDKFRGNIHIRMYVLCMPIFCIFIKKMKNSDLSLPSFVSVVENHVQRISQNSQHTFS